MVTFISKKTENNSGILICMVVGFCGFFFLCVLFCLFVLLLFACLFGCFFLQLHVES